MAREVLILEVRGRGFRRVAGNIRRVEKSASSLNRTLGFLRSALVVFASIRILQGFIALADSLTLIRNRIRTVTRDIQTLNAVQNRLFKISQRTRTSFEGNATVFARFARAAGNLGITYEELLKITEGVNQAVQISGSTAQEARAALIQFSQGLSSGALQGEELRSVSEQIPRLAEAIGREFGIAAGELIAFNRANPGIFITERVVKALRNELPKLNDEFKAINVTIAQAFERLNNSLIIFVGNTNSAVGVTKLIADGLTSLAKNLDKVVLILGTIAATVAFNIIVDQLFRLRRTLGLVITAVLVPFLKILRLIRAVLFGIAAVIGALFVLTNFAIFLSIVLALGAAFLVWGDKVSDLKDEIDKAGGFMELFLKATRFALAAVVAAWDLFVNDFDFIWDRTVRIVEAAMRKIARVILKQIFEILTVINGVKIGSIFGKAVLEIKTLGLAKKVQSLIPKEGEDVSKLFGEVGDKAKKKFDEAFKADPVKGIQEFFDGVKKFFSGTGGLGDLDKELPVFGAVSNINKFQKALEKLLGTTDKAAKLFFTASKAVETLVGSMEAGAITGDKAAVVMTRLLRTASGVGNATAVFNDQLKILNTALVLGAISAEEYNSQLRKIRITFLESQRDFSSGVSVFFNKYIEDATNTAKNVEFILGQTFDSLEDQLVQLAKTGEFSFNAIAQAASDAFIRKGVKQALGGLAEAFGLGKTETPEEKVSTAIVQAFKDGGDIAAEKLKRALSFGTGTFSKEQRDVFNIADTEKQLDGSAKTIENITTAFDGSFFGFLQGLGGKFTEFLGGFGSILSSLASSVIGMFTGGGSGSTGADIGNILGSIGSSLTKATHGLDFGVSAATSSATVSGGGVDNRLIAFRANDREQVSVTPKGERSGGGITQNITVVTSDADSFARNQSQILNESFIAAQSASRRFS